MHTGIRIRQALFSFGMSLIPDKQTGLNGKGSAGGIVPLFEEIGAKRILLTTTAGMVKRGTLDALLAEFEEYGIKVFVFTDIVPDPTDENVNACVSFYKANECEEILAIGGGSVIDCTKAAGALIVNPGKTIKDISGTMKVGRKLPFFVAVPTTAGTGSEATASAVITSVRNGTHYKHPINDTHMIPNFIVLDPEYTVTMPQNTTAYTGIDALSHAVEAYTNRFALPKTRKEALKTVGMVFGNIRKAYDDGSDIEARENMQLASYYGGLAIEHNFVGYVHAMSHAIGGLYGLPHGYINAILMPAVLRQYGECVYVKLARLAKAAGVAGPGTVKENAEAFINALCELNEYCGIPSQIAELKADDFEFIMKRAVNEAVPAYPVPRIWNETDFTEVLTKVSTRG